MHALIRMIFCCLLIHVVGLAAAEKEKKGKSQRELVGAALTPANALFPRHAYSKNSKGQEIELPSVTRSLLIFLDDAENRTRHLGALTHASLVALLEKAGPILISGNLLHNMFAHFSTQEMEQLDTLKHLLLKKMKDSEKRMRFLHVSEIAEKAAFEYVDLLCGMVVESFDPEEWIIKLAFSSKKSGDGLYLLIPKSYVQEKEKEWESFQKLDLDQIMGLRLSEMESIDDTKKAWSSRFLSRPYRDEDSGEIFLEALNTGKLFVPRMKYPLSVAVPLPQWVIYLIGHGIKNTDISGMKLTGFKNFLKFLNNNILTKLFVYQSCYSAGINREEVYNEASKNSGDTYRFPIVAVGTSEAAALLLCDAKLSISPSGDLALSPFLDFGSFIRLAERSEPEATLYTELLPSIIEGLDVVIGANPKTALYDIEVVATNYPLIRFPHRGTFVPLIPTVEITERLALTRGSKKSLDIESYGMQKIQQFAGVTLEPSLKRELCVILKAPYVPFEVRFMTKYLDMTFVLISTLMGTFKEDSMHIFNTVTTNYPFDPQDDPNFFMIFRPIEYASKKIFLIRKLTVEDALDPTKKTVYTNVLIAIKDQISTVFYTTAAGQRYKAIVGGESDVTKEAYLKPYQKAIKAIESRYNEKFKKVEEIRVAEGSRAYRSLLHEAIPAGEMCPIL